MAYLPHGSAQRECIWLPYTVTELSAGLSLSKSDLGTGQAPPQRRGKGEKHASLVCTLDRQNLETCYNAIQQLCLQAKPHIFVHTEVFVAVFIFHRSHGEETNIALVMIEYSIQGSLVTL